MQYLYKAVLVILVLLAASSGITKILLMQQEIDFFSKYGFSNPQLIMLGVVQLLGGLSMILTRTRFFGALAVYVTFVLSAFVLVLEDNRMLVIFTVIAIVLLGVVMRKTRNDGFCPV